jgi:hypothetical protein
LKVVLSPNFFKGRNLYICTCMVLRVKHGCTREKSFFDGSFLNSFLVLRTWELWNVIFATMFMQLMTLLILFSLVYVVLWFLIWIWYDLFHEEKTYRNDCVLIVPNTIIFHDCPISDWLFGFLGLVPCLHDLLHSDEQSCSSSKEEQKFSGILSLNLSIFWLKIFLILMVHHSAK